jgi:tetratricopeptide (TPR) repeat protein
MYKSIFNSVVAICLCFILFNCEGKFGEIKLSGRYVLNTGSEYSAIIEFTGKSFTITDYPVYENLVYMGRDLSQWRLLSFNKIYYENLTPINSNPMNVDRFGRGTETRYKSVTKGTYSVSGDEIELIYPDNDIKVFSFSRTENTVTIAGEHFIRMRFNKDNYSDEVSATIEQAFERGEEAFKNQKYDEAIGYYNEVIQIHPSKEAYSNLGLAYSGKKDYDRAISSYNQAIRMDPNYGIIYHNMGLAYIGKKNYNKAIAMFKKVIKLDQSSVDGKLYYGMGLAYSGKKDYDKSIENFTKVLILNSGTEEELVYLSYVFRGNAYSEKKDYGEAFADYTKAIQLDSDKELAYISRGYSYAQKGDFDEAVEDGNQAIMRASDSASSALAYSVRGYSYAKKGDFDNAIEDSNQAMRLDIKCAFAYYSRGVAYLGKKDYDNAIADFKISLRIEPNEEDVKKSLAEAQKLKRSR